jgi:hypothetical protein
MSICDSECKLNQMTNIKNKVLCPFKFKDIFFDIEIKKLNDYKLYMKNINNYTKGWNNSIYLGEYDSNSDYAFSYVFDPVDSVDMYEVSFNLLLIEPKNPSLNFDAVENLFSRTTCGPCYEIDNSNLIIEVNKLGNSIKNKKEVRIIAQEYNIKIKSYADWSACGTYLYFINMTDWS